MRKFLTTLVLAASVTLGACTSAQSESPDILNATCPGMGGEVDPAGKTADWNGHQIGFCCDGCRPKFEALSDDEKVAALAKVGVDTSK